MEKDTEDLTRRDDHTQPEPRLPVGGSPPGGKQGALGTVNHKYKDTTNRTPQGEVAPRSLPVGGATTSGGHQDSPPHGNYAPRTHKKNASRTHTSRGDKQTHHRRGRTTTPSRKLLASEIDRSLPERSQPSLHKRTRDTRRQEGLNYTRDYYKMTDDSRMVAYAAQYGLIPEYRAQQEDIHDYYDSIYLLMANRGHIIWHDADCAVYILIKKKRRHRRESSRTRGNNTNKTKETTTLNDQIDRSEVGKEGNIAPRRDSYATMRAKLEKDMNWAEILAKYETEE